MFKIKIQNFNLKQIAISGQCFRMKELDDGVFEIIASAKYLLASQSGDEVSFYCTKKEFDKFWSHYFDLETDYGKIIKSIDKKDKYLTNAATSCPGVRILNQDLWEMIITFIISQQNNIPRIKSCVSKLCEKYGNLHTSRTVRPVSHTQPVSSKNTCIKNLPQTYYAFPTPDKLAALHEDDLAKLGLGYRSKYIIAAARQVVSGELNLNELRTMNYEDARFRLLKVYGIGNKVADCVCLFGLHHVDAFPIDTHIKQILASNYKKGFPFARYNGYAGILQQYMFYYDLHH